MTVERIVGELAKIGFANMQDYTGSTPDGDPYLDDSKLTRVRPLRSPRSTVDDFVVGRGEDARVVRRVKFKLHDKRAALVDLGRNLGMLQDAAAGLRAFAITINVGTEGR
ncbi:MAG: hypothetical protein ABSD30_05670 [Candidatus Binatus sp.]